MKFGGYAIEHLVVCLDKKFQWFLEQIERNNQLVSRKTLEWIDQKPAGRWGKIKERQIGEGVPLLWVV